MNPFRALFPDRKPAIGMVHLPPLPGSPRFAGRMDAVIEHAVADARALAAAGFDAIMVENMGDAPFFPGAVPPETIAALAVCAAEIRRAAPLPLGVNVLRNDARAAVAIAAVSGAAMIRVNVHTGAVVADQGVIEGRAYETLRARATLAPGLLILADVRVKHAQPLGAPAPIDQEAADALERGLADALIVTGPATGRAARPEEVAHVRAATHGHAPVLVGSGVRADTAGTFGAVADGVIVGTALKPDGRIGAPIDAALARAFVDAWRAATR